MGSLEMLVLICFCAGAATETKGAKNLARRTEGADVEGDAHAALHALADACAKGLKSHASNQKKDVYRFLSVPRGDADNDNNVSFYSQSGFSECIRAVEELSGQIDSTTLQVCSVCVCWTVF